MNQELPFDRQQVEAIAATYPTPFHIYDEARIRENAQNLVTAMQAADFTDFRNYFAVKALPNPYVMQSLAAEGQGMDCSSLAELELADRIGLHGEDIMFTSNNTTLAEYGRAVELGAIINFDDISHIEPFLKAYGPPAVACCRYNPGNISFGGVNEAIIGKPSEAKYGMTKPQIIEAFQQLKQAGSQKFGLHTMLLSNDLDYQNHEKIARLLFELAVEIHEKTGLEFDFINLGGGIGVPYRPEEKAFDVTTFAQVVRQAYDETGLDKIGSPRLVMENGRYMTADAGYLVTEVINIKRTHKTYIGVDASMSNLMRPGMYGAYHHITILGKGSGAKQEVVDVTGSLCENNDKFAIDRQLPKVTIGDYLIIHTTGAHGHAMGFQYNGKLRSAELLLRAGNKVECIRRAETLDDYFATLSGNGVVALEKEK